MYALDHQLNDMLAEGMANRFQRHLEMRDETISWASGRGFELFAPEGYRSPTVTCITNNLAIDVTALNNYLRSQDMIISDGYGALKGQNFRIAHMGDLQFNELESLLTTLDRYLVL
jgi:aspartate aminotransferase-like enzyme